jgi:phenylalanyl-tRNA synthetase alpha chain
MPIGLTADQLRRDLAVHDLTDPAAGSHAIQLVVDRAVRALAQLWHCQVRWWRGDRIVSIEDNYDHLGFGAMLETRGSGGKGRTFPMIELRSQARPTLARRSGRHARAHRSPRVGCG